MLRVPGAAPVLLTPAPGIWSDYLYLQDPSAPSPRPGRGKISLIGAPNRDF